MVEPLVGVFGYENLSKNQIVAEFHKFFDHGVSAVWNDLVGIIAE